MKGTLVVDTPEDYQAWLKERAELAGGAQSSAPAGAPKTENKPLAQPENKPAAPRPSPNPSG
jgi:heme/copper-type cytochrome/quinol oxidase subunit 2